MKATVLRDQLKEGLAVVERVVAKSAALPILNHVLLVAEKTQLELAATDLEMGTRYRLLAKVEQEGKTVIPARSLSSFVGLLPENKVVIEVDGQGLHVTARGYAATIKTLDPEEFPIIPQPVAGESPIQIATRIFCDGLAGVMGMAGQTQTRPEISGVLFLFDRETLCLTATDSFRLAEKKLQLEKPAEQQQRFILPQKTAKEIVAVLGERPHKTALYVSSSQAVFEYNPPGGSESSIQIVSRLIEGEYPHYQEIIPSDYKAKAVVAKNEFLNQLKAASIFVGRLHDVHISIDPERHGIELTTQNAELGSHTSFLEGAIQGEPMSAVFNWRFLFDGVAQIRGEKLEMGFSAPEGPAVIRPLDAEGYLYVVMPVRS